MRVYPFPDKVASREELKRDLLYKKIPEKDRIPICDAAWTKGAATAEAICKEYGTRASIREIIEGSGLTITPVYKDNVLGGIRYFSEYYSGRKTIYTYQVSIEKWAKENKMTVEEAEELILAHEFYHHLECTKIGLTSKDYLVDNLKIGSLVLSRSGIRALSEIGAHGFSRTFFELRGELPAGTKNEIQLRNRAMNLMDFEGKQRAQKMSAKVFGKILMEEIRGKKR